MSSQLNPIEYYGVEFSGVTLLSHMHLAFSAATALNWVLIILLLFFIVLPQGFDFQNNMVIWLVAHLQGGKYKNIHSNIICISKKLEATKYLLIGECKNKLCPVHTTKYHAGMKTNTPQLWEPHG